MSASSRASRRFGRVQRFAAALLRLAVRGCVHALPRSPGCWVFGSGTGAYTDNAMYLFEYVRKWQVDIDAVWITPSRSLARSLRATDRRAYWKWSAAGVRSACRAGVNVYSSGPDDTNFALTGGAIGVNLYHGVPLKSIEFDIEVGPARPVYHPGSLGEWLRSRVIYAPKWSRHDLVVAPSGWVASTMERAFAGRIAVTVPALPPRIPALLRGDSTSQDLHERTRRLMDHLDSQDGEVLLYLPTWRRGSGFDLSRALPTPERLEQVLEDCQLTLLVKSHAFDTSPPPVGNRIRVVEHDVDATALLMLADGLITDYSSALFDFALLRRPILFHPYDVEEYMTEETGRFTLSYDVLAGQRVLCSTEDLLRVLESGEWRDWTLDEDVVSMIWDSDLIASAEHSEERLVDVIRRRAVRGSR